jgi:hypothetical protein
MFKHTLPLAMSLGAFVLACSSAETAAGSAGDEQDIKAQQCGGLAGTRCPSGFECVFTSVIPDLPGTCKKSDGTAKEGDACGGAVPNAKPCAEGLSCVGADPHVPGSRGKCESDTAKEGEACGGAVLNAKPCAQGLSCEGANPHVPGSRGTCTRLLLLHPSGP